MRRYTFIRLVNQAVGEGDICVFIGDSISREAYMYDRPGNLYIPDGNFYGISMALGIAIGTDRRVFICCDSVYILRNLSELAHLAVSGCKNLFIIIHQNSFYLEDKSLPNIFDSFSNPHGVLFNMGFRVHDYSRSFNNQRNPIKELKSNWRSAVGPLVVLMRFSSGTKSLPKVPFSATKSILRLKDFMGNSNGKTHKQQIVPTHTLNLDEIKRITSDTVGE